MGEVPLYMPWEVRPGGMGLGHAVIYRGTSLIRNSPPPLGPP